VFLAFIALAAVFRFSMLQSGDDTTVKEKTANIITEKRISLKEKIQHSKPPASVEKTSNRIVIDTIVKPVICHGLPVNRNVRFFPPEVHLIVIVDDDRQHQINNDDFETSIEYSRLLEMANQTCMPVVSRKPAWVVECKIYPAEIEFLFE
jgi:hypothetical protein